MDIEIKGLNLAKGISLSGGTVEAYKEMLEAFYEDGFERIRELTKCVETENITLYTVHVHGLKSAAALIGGDELSGAAYALEMAGNRNDWDFIETHNAEFIESLESLLDNINEKINREEAEVSLDLNELKNKLDELKLAIEGFNAGAMNSIIDSLMEMTQGSYINADVKNIFKNILVGEFDEAALLTESLAESLKESLL